MECSEGTLNWSPLNTTLAYISTQGHAWLKGVSRSTGTTSTGSSSISNRAQAAASD